MERIYLDCVDEDRCWTMAFRGQLLTCSCESELYQRSGDGRIRAQEGMDGARSGPWQ